MEAWFGSSPFVEGGQLWSPSDPWVPFLSFFTPDPSLATFLKAFLLLSTFPPPRLVQPRPGGLGVSQRSLLRRPRSTRGSLLGFYPQGLRPAELEGDLRRSLWSLQMGLSPTPRVGRTDHAVRCSLSPWPVLRTASSVPLGLLVARPDTPLPDVCQGQTKCL